MKKKSPQHRGLRERGDKTSIANIPRGNADSLNAISLQSVVHFKLEINGQKPSQFTQSNG